MENYVIRNSVGYYPSVIKEVPLEISGQIKILLISNKHTDIGNKREFINLIKAKLDGGSIKEEERKMYYDFIENNHDILYQIYKYIFPNKHFSSRYEKQINKLNNFVESGIL